MSHDVSTELDLPIADGELFTCVDDSGATGALVSWIIDGIERGERVVLVTSNTLAMRLLDAMQAERLPVARYLGDERIRLVPASIVVRAVTEGGEIDPTLYDALVGRLCGRLAGEGRIRVLSEITDEAVRQLGPEAALLAEQAWSRVVDDLDGAVLSLADLTVGAAVPLAQRL